MISMISYTLGSAFPGTRIYTEQSQQVKRPAFFIRALETVQTKKIGNLYVRSCSFVIRYHPKEDNRSDYRNLEDIADQLYAALEWMRYDGQLLRGYEMKHRVEDNVLQFFLTCKQNLKRPINDPLMDSLETKIEQKG